MIGRPQPTYNDNMRQHIDALDHVVVVVRDLDAARDSFRRMGFTVTPRGVHSLGSQNHCVMFGSDYIELLWSPDDVEHPSRRYYSDFARVGEGAAALAFKTDSAKGAYTEMLWAGFDPTPVAEFSRPVTLPEGDRDAIFRVSMASLDKTPGGRVFVCEHVTPQVVWRPEYVQHANGATALAAVAMVTEDVVGSARVYERLFHTQAATIDEGLLVEAGPAPVAFVTERALARRLPHVWISARPAPLIAALFIRVADRNATERSLRDGGFAPLRMPDGAVAIGADVAHGVALVFG